MQGRTPSEIWPCMYHRPLHYKGKASYPFHPHFLRQNPHQRESSQKKFNTVVKRIFLIKDVELRAWDTKTRPVDGEITVKDGSAVSGSSPSTCNGHSRWAHDLLLLLLGRAIDNNLGCWYHSLRFGHQQVANISIMRNVARGLFVKYFVILSGEVPSLRFRLLRALRKWRPASA